MKRLLLKVERQSKILLRQKELEEEHNIIFPEGPTVLKESTSEPDNQRDTSGSRRKGESAGEDLDDDDARERKKEDGND